jgi:hypothetical protein
VEPGSPRRSEPNGLHLSASLEISGPEKTCFPHDRRAYGLRCRDLVGRWSNALASTPKALAGLSTKSIVALYSERSSGADIGAIDISLMGQRLLRQALRVSSAPQIRGEDLSYVHAR